MKNSPKNTDKLFKTIDAIDKLFAAQQSSVSTAFTTRVSSVKKKNANNLYTVAAKIDSL